jgi:hypothetical protein
MAEKCHTRTGAVWLERLLTVLNRDGKPAQSVLEFATAHSNPSSDRKGTSLSESDSHGYPCTRTGTPPNREGIDWKLVTDLPGSSPLRAIEKLEWYTFRWKIEIFHKS